MKTTSKIFKILWNVKKPSNFLRKLQIPMVRYSEFDPLGQSTVCRIDSKLFPIHKNIKGTRIKAI